MIMITGSAGYIGRNLCKRLSTKYDLILVDKVFGCRVENLKSIPNSVKTVVHLAGMPGIQQCETDFHNAIVDNVLSAENIFRLAKVPVIFISSQAAKYPTSKYAIMKLICETMALKMGHSVLRLANVYGGEYYLELKTSVIANFINAKKNNKSMVIVGNGEQIRDFIHVSEVCQAIEMAFGKEKIIVDVGTGVGRSINEIANMMEYDNIIYDHSNNMNIESNISDINPAKEILSFVAKDELESYIRMMH